MKIQTLSKFVGFIWLSLGIISCKKFVEVGPPKTGLVDASVFASKSTTEAAIIGFYADMQNSSFASGNEESISHVCGMSADELVNYSTSIDNDAVYKNSISPLNFYPSGSTWNNPYYYIYKCNNMIAGIEGSTAIDSASKRMYVAETKFIRAFCYFYLTNLYGDVPLYLATDYKVNQVSSKSQVTTVYAQITEDLLDAAAGMQSPGVSDTRSRPNSDVALAMLARVYLFTKKYQNAIDAASSLINKSDRYYLLPDLQTVFLKESSEAIWQLQPVIPGINTNEGYHFILTSAPLSAALSNQLVNAFEPQDARKGAWVGSYDDEGTTYYFPYKYKVQYGSTLTEYSMVMRLAEQYLIRAEARTMMGDLIGAAKDINAIRTRAGLTNTTATNQADLLLAIEHERQVELFTEWGHRWLDLKRTGRATAVLSPIKPEWKPTAVLYPIPQAEINANPNIHQNDGY